MSNTFSLLSPFFPSPPRNRGLIAAFSHSGLALVEIWPIIRLRKFRTRAFTLTLQGESYQPESKTQQPPQRRPEFPPRRQAGRQQRKTGRHRRPSRTTPACREWLRTSPPGGTIHRTGSSQNGRSPPPRRRPQPSAPARRRRTPHQGQKAFQQIGSQGRKLRK